MHDKDRELMIKSLDANLSAGEKQRLNKALNGSQELRDERKKLLEMRDKLKSAALKSFDRGFSDRVMAGIKNVKADDIGICLLQIFRPVAAAAVVLIILMASFNILNSDQVSLDGVLSIGDIAPAEAFDPLIDLARE